MSTLVIILILVISSVIGSFFVSALKGDSNSSDISEEHKYSTEVPKLENSSFSGPRLKEIENIIRVVYDLDEQQNSSTTFFELRHRFQIDEEWDLLGFLENYFNLVNDKNYSSLEYLRNILKSLSKEDSSLAAYYSFYYYLWMICSSDDSHTFSINEDSIILLNWFSSSFNRNKKIKPHTSALVKLLKQILQFRILEKDLVGAKGATEDTIQSLAKFQDDISYLSEKEEQKAGVLFTIERDILIGHSNKLVGDIKSILSKYNKSLELEDGQSFELDYQFDQTEFAYSKQIQVNLKITNKSLHDIENVFYRLYHHEDLQFNMVCNKVHDLGVLSKKSPRIVSFDIQVTNTKKRYRIQIELGYITNGGEERSDAIQQTISFTEIPKYSNNRPYNPEPKNSRISYFYGRTSLIRKITRLINYENSGSFIGIYGLARMGKTALLYEVLDSERFDNKIISVFYNLDELLDWNDSWDQTFLQGLIDRIIKAFESAEIHLPRISSTYEDRESILNKLLENTQRELERRSKKLIIVIDEFQRIEEFTTPKTKDKKKKIIKLFKQIAVHEDQTSIIVCGYHDLVSLARKDRSWDATLGKGYESIKVSFLSKDESLQLINEPMTDFGIDYEDGVAQKIWGLTRGYPWFIQIICDKLFEHIVDSEEDEKKTITIDDFDTIIYRLLYLNEKDDVFIHITGAEWANKIMEAIIMIIAKANMEESILHGEYQDKYVSRNHILKVFNDHGKNLSLQVISRNMDELERKDILLREEINSENHYAVSLPILSQWYKAIGDMTGKLSGILED